MTLKKNETIEKKYKHNLSYINTQETPLLSPVSSESPTHSITMNTKKSYSINSSKNLLIKNYPKGTTTEEANNNSFELSNQCTPSLDANNININTNTNNISSNDNLNIPINPITSKHNSVISVSSVSLTSNNNNTIINNTNNTLNNPSHNNNNNINNNSNYLSNSMNIPEPNTNHPKNYRVTSSPPVPPLAIGKDDSVYEDEIDNQIVIVVDPNTSTIPLNERIIPINDPKKIPNSIDDWILYHASQDPEKSFLSPDEPPNDIPVLESMFPLDEVITPQRSVSCRIHLLQQQRRKQAQEQSLVEKEKQLHQQQLQQHQQHQQQRQQRQLHQQQRQQQQLKVSLSTNDSLRYSTPLVKIPSAVKVTNRVKQESTNQRNGASTKYQLQKSIPRFQLCNYNKCDWIATTKCERCLTLCCLDHSHRFYYFLPSLFSPKYYCPKCMNKISRFWKFFYLICGTLVLLVLIAGCIYRSAMQDISKFILPIFVIALSLLTLALFSLSYLSSQFTLNNTKDYERPLLN